MRTEIWGPLNVCFPFFFSHHNVSYFGFHAGHFATHSCCQGLKGELLPVVTFSHTPDLRRGKKCNEQLLRCNEKNLKAQSLRERSWEGSVRLQTVYVVCKNQTKQILMNASVKVRAFRFLTSEEGKRKRKNRNRKIFGLFLFCDKENKQSLDQQESFLSLSKADERTDEEINTTRWRN